MRRSALLVVAALALATSACSSADAGAAGIAPGDVSPLPPSDDTYGTRVTAPGADADRATEPERDPPASSPLFATVMRTSFEAASAVCNDWAAAGADAIRSVPPHSGSYACRICATGSAADISIAHSAGPLEPGRYVLTAWLRKRPNNVGPEGALALLEADTEGGVVAVSSPIVLTDDYAKVTVTLDLPTKATAIRARLGAPASATQCLLIDDVLVERAR